MKKLSIVKNQTFGGGDKYSKNVILELQKKYIIDFFEPKKLQAKTQSPLLKILQYIHYVYMYLPKYYRNVGKIISQDKQYDMVIIFQDGYRKCPDIFQTLSKKSAYVLHEPPREFYEPLSMHTSSLTDKIFTILFRGAVFFSDRNNTSKSDVIISNSLFSYRQIKKIYKKDSVVVYPGFSSLFNVKMKRKNQCLSVGSLLPYKGHSLAIEAIGKIMVNKPNLVIIGNGPVSCKEALKTKAAKCGVRMKIISSLSDKKLGEIYNESKLYINAAYQEPFGMTSLEAIGHGCNLVTVNNCGTEELKKYFPKKVIVTERNGIAISNGIIESMTKNNNIPRMDKFTWSNTARQIIEAIH